MAIENKRILVVDDDPMVRSAYLETLVSSRSDQTDDLKDLLIGEFNLGEDETNLTLDVAKLSFEVVVASSGEEAIELQRQAMDRNEPFALAFVDVRMPGGMDGIECSGQLRHIDPRTYIVIVSAYSDYSLDEINTHIGYEFIYLRKPFISEELYQMARAYSTMWGRQEELQQKVGRLEKQLLECRNG